MKKKIAALAGIAGLTVTLNGAPAIAQVEFGSPELIAAAKKGRQARLLHSELRRSRATRH
jgi:hypothetical protein